MVGRNIKRSETKHEWGYYYSVFLVFAYNVECLYISPLFSDITVVRHRSLKSLEKKRHLKIHRNLFDHTFEELFFVMRWLRCLNYRSNVIIVNGKALFKSSCGRKRDVSIFRAIECQFQMQQASFWYQWL